MSNQVVLRQYKKEDALTIQNIIRKAWHYDAFGSPKTAAKLAKIFLYSCLANQTYTLVAEINGKAAGVIMGKNIKKHKAPLHYRMKQIFSIISLYRTKEGRTVSKIFENVNKIDEELLTCSGRDYQGEVAFFALDDKYRGLGIGKMLFEKMLTYMQKEGVQDFYLFTDTSCNYGFYEHQGMKRRGEKKVYFTIHDQENEMNFFIYDYVWG